MWERKGEGGEGSFNEGHYYGKHVGRNGSRRSAGMARVVLRIMMRQVWGGKYGAKLEGRSTLITVRGSTGWRNAGGGGGGGR